MYLLFSMNTIKYEIKIGNGNIEQNTLLINTHINTIYLLKYHVWIFMFIKTFSNTITFNFSSFWFFAWTKMHEKPVQLFHLILPNKLDGCKGNTAKAW